MQQHISLVLRIVVQKLCYCSPQIYDLVALFLVGLLNQVLRDALEVSFDQKSCERSPAFVDRCQMPCANDNVAPDMTLGGRAGIASQSLIREEVDQIRAIRQLSKFNKKMVYLQAKHS